MVRITDRPDITSAVYRGCTYKAINKTKARVDLLSACLISGHVTDQATARVIHFSS